MIKNFFKSLNLNFYKLRNVLGYPKTICIQGWHFLSGRSPLYLCFDIIFIKWFSEKFATNGSFFDKYFSMYWYDLSKAQKQPSRGVLSKRCSENCSKFTGEHPCQSVISIKLLCNFIEITLRHGCSLVNLLHIFRTLFSRNTSGWLLLKAFSAQHCLVSTFEKEKSCNNKRKSFGALMTDL